ncbi:MAG: hypothetical protein KDD44_14405 [Bdellovibrionales bacterium]|nr:hypothetical protein [Bdellovibrionales bacterium]
MAYNRHRKKNKIRRQYTFTKTKAVIGFVLSAFFSVLLSSIVDAYQSYAYRETRQMITAEDAAEIAAPGGGPEALPPSKASKPASLDDVARQIDALDSHPGGNT